MTPAAGDGPPDESGDDRRVREVAGGSFALEPGLVHVNAMIMASPPRPVRDAVARHRDGFDRDPTGYFYGRVEATGIPRPIFETERAARAAADYLGLALDGPTASATAYVAQTTGTTMGLALLANGLRVGRGQEVVVSFHDYPGLVAAWESRCLREAVQLRTIRLYDDPRSPDLAREVVENVDAALGERTRVLALTWVHSSTGVKLPLEAIAARLREHNAGRRPHERVLVCLDGVHGCGVEDRAFDELGCDFLVTGCHKWIFGPRGTGIVCARPEAWDEVTPTIPSSIPSDAAGARETPGGVQCYEHAWAIPEAFGFHAAIGKPVVARYTHRLAAQLKAGLAALDHVDVVTPMDEALSSGVVCCDVRGLSAGEAVHRLRALHVVAMPSSSDAWGRTHLRFAPSVINTPDEIARVVDAVATLGRR